MSGTALSTGTISVPGYPANNLVPGLFFSVNPTNANTAAQNQRTLIIGQKIATGSGFAPNVPTQTVAVADVIAGCGGANSMIARMVKRYRRSDPLADVWVLPIIDDPAATATVVTLTPTGPATAAGAIALMIAGEEVQIPVNVGDTPQIMGTNIAQMVNQVADMPCTAVLGTGPAYIVTLTADNLGAAAGDLDVRLNYYGAPAGEILPAGVGIAIATTATGATNPSTALTTALANLGDKPFDVIVCPYTDAASLSLLDSLLSLTTGRWSWQQQIYGNVFTAFRGTLGQRITFATSRDDAFISCIGFLGSPTPAYEWAADFAAACALSIRANPAVPLGGMGGGVPLTVLAPPVSSRDVFATRETLLQSGMSTYLVGQAGAVRVERAVNLYTTNAAGQPDNSFRDVETNFCIMASLRDFLSVITSQFSRKTLVADGTVIAGGSSMVTSQTILAAIIARYRTQCAFGLCQNPTQFASQAQAVNAGNGTVDVYLPLQIANQLRVVAGNVAFSKP